MLLENVQSHSTIISWWSRTSNTKLIERGSPLSLSVWLSHSWPSETITGWAWGLITGGPGITGTWPPIGGLVPGAGPTGILPGERGPIIGIIGGSCIRMLASNQDKKDPGDWGEVESLPLQEEEQRMEWEASFLVEMPQLFSQSGFEPALLSVSDSRLSHSLCVSFHCSVSFSQMEGHGWGMYHSSHNKTWACCSEDHWPLCSFCWFLLGISRRRKKKHTSVFHGLFLRTPFFEGLLWGFSVSLGTPPF